MPEFSTGAWIPISAPSQRVSFAQAIWWCRRPPKPQSVDATTLSDRYLLGVRWSLPRALVLNRVGGGDQHLGRAKHLSEVQRALDLPLVCVAWEAASKV